MLRPLSSHSSRSNNGMMPVFITAAILLLIIGGIVYLGSSTPAPTQTSYEKVLDAAR